MISTHTIRKQTVAGEHDSACASFCCVLLACCATSHHDVPIVSHRQSRLAVGSTFASVFMPLIGSYLAQRSLRLPLIISLVLCLLNLTIVTLGVRASGRL